ncbi:MAG: hypothetical protein KatS3mg030_368 [Saprospiraceae bacterium]|nr:MAG: hypothetical protein KatS3mg030_368 [Saprospiraceae bacterium]
MKTRFILASLFLLNLLTAQAQLPYAISKGEIKIEGTSTLHDWTANTKALEGQALFNIENGVPKGIAKLEVSTKVKSIKSEKGSTMDKNMYKALKADNHPVLRFKLTKANYLNKVGSDYQVSITGDLTVAGTTRSITITGKGKSGATSLDFEGSFKLKMTDFNVEPPSLFLGTLQTGDEVTIHYKVSFTPATASTR